ncbi:sodium- and chloride-dependent creatine transporter 1-like [Aplysia californica]|uniref:Transporter n=1 Tax=Aplysia californica TaxID=6500 RepID=A0ABM1VQS4_APLCA|nr:sodium- and chloride-dependent creatine transporter 1-like [Aplysia californica]
MDTTLRESESYNPTVDSDEKIPLKSQDETKPFTASDNRTSCEMESSATRDEEHDDTAIVIVGDNKSLNEDDEPEDEERVAWGRKAEYFLSMIGYCVGLGNVWRFPYVCIRNGGGAFLIPFFVCLLGCGLPLYFLEVALGQFVAKSSLHVFSICPLFKGVGIAMNVLCTLCSWYYSMILGWTLIFLVHSFRDPLPWTQCGQWWNSDQCVPTIGHSVNAALGNGTDASGPAFNTSYAYNITQNITSVEGNLTKSASVEFWLHNILESSPGFAYPDGLPWHTVLGLVVASIIVVLCIIKGVQSVGKVVYVTATLPYILITVLVIKGSTLSGAMEGIIFYVKPDFR